jgi:DNA-binding MarR family transcriptional regulator
MTDDRRDHDLGPAEIADHLRLTAGRLTRRLRQHVLSGLEDVTPAQYLVLALLYGEEPMTLSDLAGSQRTRLPTLTRTVNRLEAMGLVTRRRSPADARAVLVRLTRAGRALVTRIRTEDMAYLASRVAELDAESRVVLLRALGVIDRIVSDLADEAGSQS